MTLPHLTPDCTGRWHPRSQRGTMYWQCSVCGAIGYDCMENHELAIRENALGECLDLLTAEGRRLLDSEGTVP